MAHVLERAGWSSYGNLADELVFSIAEYKKGRIAEREKIYFLAVRDFLDRIIFYEKNKEKPMKICDSLSFLEGNGIFNDSWIASDVSFPKNDEEYLTTLIKYRNCIEEIYNTQKSSDEKTIGDIEKIFDKMGDISLHRIHKCSLHDLPKCP